MVNASAIVAVPTRRMRSREIADCAMVIVGVDCSCGAGCDVALCPISTAAVVVVVAGFLVALLLQWSCCEKHHATTSPTKSVRLLSVEKA